MTPTVITDDESASGTGRIVVISGTQAAVLAKALEAVLAEARPSMAGDRSKADDLRAVEGLRRMLLRAR